MARMSPTHPFLHFTLTARRSTTPLSRRRFVPLSLLAEAHISLAPFLYATSPTRMQYLKSPSLRACRSRRKKFIPPLRDYVFI
jgi:hypothetical protein